MEPTVGLFSCSKDTQTKDPQSIETAFACMSEPHIPTDIGYSSPAADTCVGMRRKVLPAQQHAQAGGGRWDSG